MVSKYEHEVKKYGKKDAIIALCVFVAIIPLSLMSWVITGDVHATLFGFLSRVIIIGITVAIVIVKKQGLASIGIHKDKLWPALRLSLLLLIIFVVFGIVPGLIYGWELIGIGTLFPALGTTIIMAAGEDIFFVGYLQTRLHGLFKNNALAILIGAICFAIAHVPTALIEPYAAGWVGSLIIWMIGHTLMVLIFRRHFSIIPVIIAHTLGNFLGGGSLWVEFTFGSDWTGTAMLILLVALLIMEIVRWRRNRSHKLQL